ncbi:MAG: hypothetical protein ACPGD8_00940 [Flavobacteriales bacterium]
MGEETKGFTVNNEVIKFAVSVGVPLLAVVGSYFQLQSDTQEALRVASESKVRVEAVEKHNQKQDLETVAFRTEMTSRVTNIEKLTEDIHNAIIPSGN